MKEREIVMLGAFSISLNVKDIQASKLFYEKLGFTVFGGHMNENWLILKQGDTTIGLFQDMFDKNMLTFNPGWTQDAKPVASFKDIREIQKKLIDAGIKISKTIDEKTEGPAHIMIEDPDGNPILIDQHV